LESNIGINSNGHANLGDRFLRFTSLNTVVQYRMPVINSLIVR